MKSQSSILILFLCRFWSNTGGANRPQPDNREGNENCLAVLNNFYNDGVKFHDVSCHHRKPVICESSRATSGATVHLLATSERSELE